MRHRSPRLDRSGLHRDYESGDINMTTKTTYKPGDKVPYDGTVECTQYPGTRDHVKAGTTFAPCDHWRQHHPKGCTWQYV